MFIIKSHTDSKRRIGDISGLGLGLRLVAWTLFSLSVPGFWTKVCSVTDIKSAETCWIVVFSLLKGLKTDAKSCGWLVGQLLGSGECVRCLIGDERDLVYCWLTMMPGLQ